MTQISITKTIQEVDLGNHLHSIEQISTHDIPDGRLETQHTESGNQLVLWGYVGTTSPTFTGATQTVDFDTFDYEKADFPYSVSEGEFTFQESGKFLIEVEVSCIITTSSRSTTEAWLEKDTGGGFSELSGTRSTGYSRHSSTGQGTTQTFSWAGTVNKGESLRVRAERVNGTDTHQIEANFSRIKIMRIAA